MKAFTESLELATHRFEEGAAPKSDVAQAQAQLDMTRAQATDIGVQRAQLEHAIAILIGKPPAAFSLAPRRERPGRPPSRWAFRRNCWSAGPTSRPRSGVSPRPMSRSALPGRGALPDGHAERVGGIRERVPGSWFSWPGLLWAVGLSMTQTLFDGGRRHAVSDAARAAYDATVANYRQTTLTAFQQVEDNLAALRILAQEADEERRAVASARESLQLSTNRYEGGADSHLPVLVAQTIRAGQRADRGGHCAAPHGCQRLADQGAGGGWDVSDLPKE